MESRTRIGFILKRGIGLVGLALMLAGVLAPAAEAAPPHERGGVFFGIGVGFSPGKVNLLATEVTESVESGWEVGFTPRIQLGYAIVRNHLLVSVANQQWGYEQGIFAEDKLRINAQSLSLALTWCPGKPDNATGGIQLMASVGLANARLTLLEPIEDDPYGDTFEEVFKHDDSGTAFQVGVGYEIRVTRAVAFGLTVSYVRQDYDGEIFDITEVYPVNLTLNWYW